VINLQQSFPRLLYFYYKDIKGGVRDIRPPYTVLRVALVDIGTNKTVRLLENMLLRCVAFNKMMNDEVRIANFNWPLATRNFPLGLGRSLVLRKARRILAFRVLKPTQSCAQRPTQNSELK
jgi:hypothetical protein